MEEADFAQLRIELQKKIRRHKKCGGYGKLLKDGTAVDCECRIEALHEFRIVQSGIPPKFRSLGFKNYAYKDSPAFIKVQEYLTQSEEHLKNGMGLFLHGPSYTGKSLLACSLLVDLMRKGHDCRYVNFDGMLDPENKSIVRGLRRYDFILLERVSEVLDNLTAFRDAVLTGSRIHGAVEYLGNFLAQRANDSKPVIMTSRVSITEINSKFPALASTLIGTCLTVECEDKGFRQKRLSQMMDS